MQHARSNVPKVTQKTASEILFEEFCATHHVASERIPTGLGKTPDYRLTIAGTTVLVEIEQIESLAGFNPGGVSSRTVGAHVRRKISDARGQAQQAKVAGLPAILLIHNTVDPWQAFGTETHDFICAMYGELTVRLVDGRARESFHGLNAKLRPEWNTSFSAVGHLKRTPEGAEVTIFENIYGAYPLPFEALPPCFKVVRVEVEHAA